MSALPSLASLGMLMLLVVYLYALVGVYLFSAVRLQSMLNENANFQTVSTGILTLIRIATGEAWNEIMDDCARTKSLYFECHAQTYDQRQAEGIRGCGSPFFAYTYFIAFMVVVTFILMNYFIAVILQVFQVILVQDDQLIKEETITEFANAWKALDPKGTGFIKIEQLETLIVRLVSREQEIKESQNLPQSADVLFNFDHSRLLRLYTIWKLQDSKEQIEALKALKESYLL